MFNSIITFLLEKHDVLEALAAIVIVLSAVVGLTRFLRRTARRKFQKSISNGRRTSTTDITPAPSYEEIRLSLNSRFVDECEIIRVIPNRVQEPRLDPLGQYDDPAIHLHLQEINRLRRTLAAHQRDNQPQAILCETSALDDNPPTLQYKTIDYAACQTLRLNHFRPPVITAGVFLCCSQRASVLLHRRSPQSATYPNHLHVFGGAYVPEGNRRERGLTETMVRELREETRGEFTTTALKEFAFSIFAKEITTGYFQYFKFAIDITADEAEHLAAETPEGRVVHCQFDDWRKVLERSDWVPSGKMLFLLWLAAGAPITAGKSAVDPSSARSIYRDWLT